MGTRLWAFLFVFFILSLGVTVYIFKRRGKQNEAYEDRRGLSKG